MAEISEQALSERGAAVRMVLKRRRYRRQQGLCARRNRPIAALSDWRALAALEGTTWRTG